MAFQGGILPLFSKISIQLTHAGGFSDPLLSPDKTTVAPTAMLNLAGLNYPRAAHQSDMDELVRQFQTAAETCLKGGADAVELHLGHGYLLSQWLCPATNLRKDEHGGSIENRLRLPLRVLRSVRDVLGPRKGLFVKFNVADGFSNGVSPKDVDALVTALAQEEVDGIIPSAGFVSRNGFYMLRGVVPRWKMAKAFLDSSVIKAVVMALAGRWLVPEIAFEPKFLYEQQLRVVRVLERLGSPIHVLGIGGFVSLQHVEQALQDGFSGIQMARALIRQPDLPQRFLKVIHGRETTHQQDIKQSFSSKENVNDLNYISRCIHCNTCTISALTSQSETLCPRRIDDDIMYW